MSVVNASLTLLRRKSIFSSNNQGRERSIENSFSGMGGE